MSIGISAVICTYNRANLLTGAIKSLCQQILPPDSFEIIVVNNGSTDDTAEIVKSFQDRYRFHHIRLVNENNQGTGYARNAGITEAKGDYIAYLDDDARAKSDWLEIASKNIEEIEPFHCIGGPVLPFFTDDKPAWFKDQYETRTWGYKKRNLKSGEAFSGSNMIWRKDILKAIGGFGENAGPKGKNFALGEDTIAFLRLWQLETDAVIVYDPDMVIYHWVPQYKMSIFYILKRAILTGQLSIQIDRQPGWRWHLRAWIRSGGAVIVRLVQAIIKIPRYRHWQNWIVEAGKPVMVKFGAFLTLSGIKVHLQRET